MGTTTSSSSGRPPGPGLTEDIGCCNYLFKSCAKTPRVTRRRRLRSSAIDEYSVVVDFAGVNVYFNYFGGEHNSFDSMQFAHFVATTDDASLQTSKIVVDQPIEVPHVPLEVEHIAGEVMQVCTVEHVEVEEAVLVEQEIFDVAVEVEDFGRELMRVGTVEFVEVVETEPVDILEVTATPDVFQVGVDDDSTVEVIGLTDDEDEESSVDVSDMSEDDHHDLMEDSNNSAMEDQNSTQKEDDKFRESYMLPLPFVKKNNVQKKKLSSTLPKAFSSSFNLNSNTGLILPHHHLLASTKLSKPVNFQTKPQTSQNKQINGSIASMLLNINNFNPETGSSRSSSPFLRRTDSSSPSPFARSSVSSTFSQTMPANFITKFQ
jgi:hypothetical protein